MRSTPGVVTRSLLTVGDAAGTKPDGSPYRMVGIPDGLGAYDNGDGTFTVLMNHELGATSGVTRAHGEKGAFVSQWTIDRDSLEVLEGRDLITTVYDWDLTSQAWTQTTTAFGRFCSADLADPSAFHDAATGLGTQQRLLLNGEEIGAGGRAVAHVATGEQAGSSYILPWLGKFSWENAVARPGGGTTTVVAGLDDSGGGQVYFYEGEKTDAENPVEAAGLTNGTVFGLKITGSTFSLVDLGDVSGLSGTELENLSAAQGVTPLSRPEDGSWDPARPGTFWFATTGSFSSTSTLWRLDFSNPDDLTQGGTVSTPVVSPPFVAGRPSDQQRGPRMLDNLTVNARGQVLLQEDVGNQSYLGGVWVYDPSTDGLARVAGHDPARFAPGGASFLTIDEESSGIIPVEEILGRGWYLADVQAHYATGDSETVEGGQLLAIQIPPGRPVR